MPVKAFLRASPMSVLAPIISVGIVALCISLLGVLQDNISPPEHGLKLYDDIETAQTQLGFEITVPRYFPSYLSWPPAEIKGQLLPFTGVETVYNSQYGEKTLVISQIKTDKEPESSLSWINKSTEETPVTIGEYTGVLISAADSEGRPLNAARWKTDSFYYTVITNRSKNELLTIIRSMQTD